MKKPASSDFLMTVEYNGDVSGMKWMVRPSLVMIRWSCSRMLTAERRFRSERKFS